MSESTVPLEFEHDIDREARRERARDRIDESDLDALDLPMTARLSRLAGRVGHSLGLPVTEPPSLDTGSTGTFDPGVALILSDVRP